MTSNEESSTGGLMSQFQGSHGLLRQSILAYGGIKDYGGSVTISHKPMDLNNTIYKTLEGTVARAVMSSKLSIDLEWDKDVASKIEKDYEPIPIYLDHNKNLIDFMQNDCNFLCEHNEGSFMDHLQFVYDYGKTYYQEKSPRVLLLHSILGVATNIFPMEVAKEEKLKTMLTLEEMQHIEAFPSILRLILNWNLLMELKECSSEKLQTLSSISFHRCIDNKRVEMSADAFWVQLNYHVIHFLDFIPAANWKLVAGEITLAALQEIYQLLTKTDKLFAKVNLDTKETGTSSLPFGLASIVFNLLPSETLRKKASQSALDFSNKIGHSLDYELTWA